MTINENITTWEYKHILPRQGQQPIYQFIAGGNETSEDVAIELDFLYSVRYDVSTTPHTSMFHLRKQGETAWQLWDVTREIRVQAVMKDAINVPAEN